VAGDRLSKPAKLGHTERGDFLLRVVDVGTVVDAYHVDGSGLLIDTVGHPVRAPAGRAVANQLIEPFRATY
jgi:hypothetical protein